MKLSQFRRIIKEEVRKVIREEEVGEHTYVFRLSPAKMADDAAKSEGFRFIGVSEVRHGKTLPGNNDGGEDDDNEKLSQPVVLRSGYIRDKTDKRYRAGNAPTVGYAHSVYVVATPDTFSQVVNKYITTDPKAFAKLSDGSFEIQVPPGEIQELKNQILKVFGSRKKI
jgi:hypothetical protein